MPPTPNDRYRRLGSLFVVGFPGQSVDDGMRRLIGDFALGGVILFPRNFTSRDQLIDLTGELMQLAQRPFIISVDQEGGRVQRLGLPLGFAKWPTGEALGAACRAKGDTELARRMGAAMGQELLAVGINLDWAPVVDIRSNPANRVIGDRAFGTAPDEVIPVARAFLDGFRAAGMQACVKHFPGHGHTWADSHEELPVLELDERALEARELRPFSELANEAGLVMTGHLMIPSVDSAQPVTLSRRWLTEIFKGRMGYRGAIISDALEMKAIRLSHPLAKAAGMALEAGCDLLMQADSHEGVVEALHALGDACTGEKWETRLADATARADALKARLAAGRGPTHESFQPLADEIRSLGQTTSA